MAKNVIEANQNIIKKELSPFISKPVTDVSDGISSQVNFNTFTNLAGLAGNITSEVTKIGALSETRDDVIDVMEDYSSTSPTNILQAQDNIFRAQQARAKNAQAYNITENTPGLLVQGYQKNEQSLLNDIDSQIKFLMNAKGQERITAERAQAEIKLIYRKKLNEYPMLSQEILNHGALISDLYGFNDLLKADANRLKASSKRADEMNKADIKYRDSLLTEAKEENIPVQQFEIGDSSNGERPQYDYKRLALALDVQRMNEMSDQVIERLKKANVQARIDFLKTLNPRLVRDKLTYDFNKVTRRVKTDIAEYQLSTLDKEGKSTIGDNELRAGYVTIINNAELRAIREAEIKYQTYTNLGEEGKTLQIPLTEYKANIKSYFNILRAQGDNSLLSEIATNGNNILEASKNAQLTNEFGILPDMTQVFKLFLSAEFQTYLTKNKTDNSTGVDNKTLYKLYKNYLELMVNKSKDLDFLDLKGGKNKSSLGFTSGNQDLLLLSFKSKYEPGENGILNSAIDNFDSGFRLNQLNPNTGISYTETEFQQDKYKNAMAFLKVVANEGVQGDDLIGAKEDIMRMSNKMTAPILNNLVNKSRTIDDITYNINEETGMLESSDAILNKNEISDFNTIYAVNMKTLGKEQAETQFTKLFELLKQSEGASEENITTDNNTDNNMFNMKTTDDKSIKTYNSKEESIKDVRDYLLRLATGTHKNHEGKNINTIKGIIDVYRPADDPELLANPDQFISQENYINTVAKAAGVSPVEPLDLTQTEPMASILAELSRVEKGALALQKDEILKALGQENIPGVSE